MACEVTRLIGNLKRTVALEQLGRLRASNPQIPMQSALDLAEPQVPISQPVEAPNDEEFFQLLETLFDLPDQRDRQTDANGASDAQDDELQQAAVDYQELVETGDLTTLNLEDLITLEDTLT
ncbi:hypothetical protein IRJ41_013785 [Triplophysa rosa]|uniref:Uncharacterized protein n=1 Tax=Triplophysa rosa TaxID=992332 RepID=A0A9W7WNZ8_TRIRA|nr:hypothetical protein IRJ41_013785 [Triplophysa rosa]